MTTLKVDRKQYDPGLLLKNTFAFGLKFSAYYISSSGTAVPGWLAAVTVFTLYFAPKLLFGNMWG